MNVRNQLPNGCPQFEPETKDGIRGIFTDPETNDHDFLGVKDPTDPSSLVTVKEVLHGWKLQKITTMEGDFATYRYDGKGDLNPLKPPTVCDRIYTKHIGGIDDKDYDYIVSESFLVQRAEDHRVPCVRVHAMLGDDNNAVPEKDERESMKGEVSLSGEHTERETVEGEVSLDLNKEGAVEEGDEVDLAENDDHRSSSRLWKSPMSALRKLATNSHRKKVHPS